MAKLKKTPLERIQDGKGKDIAKVFFMWYFPPSLVTEIIYKKAYDMRKQKKQQGFVMPIIQNYLSEWKKAGFIETLKINIPIKRKNSKNYTIDGKGYIFNLEPLYSFCKTKNINFNSEEKSLIDSLLTPIHIRKLIINQYPKDDLINAILKFYIKNYVVPYEELYLLKNSKGLFDKEYEKLLKKKERETKKLSKIKRGIDRNKMIDEIFKFSKDLENKKSFEKIYVESTIHMTNYKDNPKFVFGIDRKFMRALGII